MTRSEKFSPVLKIAAVKKRDAARSAGEAAARLQDFQNKLQELRSFRSEYTLAGYQGNQTMNANELQERQKFLRQLDEGIRVLADRVRGQQQHRDMETQAWLEACRHADAVDRLMMKIRKLESDVRENRVELEMNDRAPRGKSRS